MASPHVKRLIRMLLSHAIHSCKKTQDMKLSEIKTAMSVFFESDDIDEVTDELIRLTEEIKIIHYYHLRTDAEPIAFESSEQALREVIKTCHQENLLEDDWLKGVVANNSIRYTSLIYSSTPLWSVDIAANGTVGYVDAIPKDAVNKYE